jgi:hypothetical protein
MNSKVIAKQELLGKLQKDLAIKDFLIFHPPVDEILYSIEELNLILNKLKGENIPQGLSTVQKSQWVKYKILELMGYVKPLGLRTKQAKEYKPKFINQLLDIFVQSSNNLQVWNYLPYDENIIDGEWNVKKIRYSQCRYVLVLHNNYGKILNFLIKTGEELKEWDNTNTKTIKWQANAPKTLRGSLTILNDSIDPLFNKLKVQKLNISQKIEEIKKLDNSPSDPLIKKPPITELLLTIDEFEKILEPLKCFTIQNPGSGQERVIGQVLEKRIAQLIGYKYFKNTDTGEYPDLLNQLIEVKFQNSGTIDLGKHLPTDPTVIDAAWNNLQISCSDMRYCVFLMKLIDNVYVTESIVLVSGKNFGKYFNICAGTNFKVQ